MNPLLKKIQEVGKAILTPLASLKITVVLLLATMLLVYVGTLAQASTDNFTVQKTYFHCWFAYMPLEHHIPFGDVHSSFGYMFLGGYSLIVGILINLIAAHTLRFKFVPRDLLLLPLLGLTGYLTWIAQAKPDALNVTLTSVAAVACLGLTFWNHAKRTGVIVIHFGLILILVGELVTALGRVETQMTLVEGETQNWTQDVQRTELAVVDSSASDHDHVVVIPTKKLPAAGETLTDAQLPFDVRVDGYYENSEIDDSGKSQAPVKATTGQGLQGSLVPLRRFTGAGADAEKVNAPGAYVTILKSGKPIETLMLSVMLFEGQKVAVDGKPYEIALRFKRSYKPYSINLVKFTHEKHIGTDKAKNFQATLRVLDPANNVDRQVVVRMNQPLRYAGDTLYQSGFNPRNPKMTTLQVVKNPGWLLPYLSCAVGGLGMFIHFGIVLLSFLDRQIRMPKNWALLVVGFTAAGLFGIVVTWASVPLSWGNALLAFVIGGPVGTLLAWVVLHYARQRTKTRATPVLPAVPLGAYTLEPKRRSLGWALPTAFAALSLFYVGSHAVPRSVTPPDRKDWALAEWGKLPMNFEGRVMPMDSLARNSLKVLYGKQTFTEVEKKKDAAGNVLKNAKGEDETVERKAQAIEWLADMLSGSPRARERKVFRIDEPQVKAFFGFKPEDKEFSHKELLPNPDPISIDPPDEWQPVAPKQFELLRYVAGKTGDAFITLSEMPNQAELEVQNLVRWANQVEAGVPTPDTLSKQMRQTTLGGKSARRVDFAGPATAEHPPLRSVIVYAFRDKKTFIIKLTGLASAVDAELPQFDRFVSGFQFNDQLEKLTNEFQRISAKKDADKNSLDLYERKMLELGGHLNLFSKLANRGALYVVPPLSPGQNWRTLTEARIAKRDTLLPEPAMEEFVVSTAAWRDGQQAEFNKSVAAYQKLIEQSNPSVGTQAAFESFYNRFSPFWVSVGLYIFVFILGCVSWLFLGGPLTRGALVVLVISFIIHTFGLSARIYISGRPPVTNLYSSAVFISWVVVLTCIFIERVFKNGLAVVAAGLVGFLSLVIADGIEFVDAVSRNEGDTMAQLQAVLDTNFWLATHVVMITMGYAATFVAGFLAIIYVVFAVFSRGGETLPDGRQSGMAAIFNGPLGQVFEDDKRKLYPRKVYGVICFAMLLSFVGTILGGIWADQSWGRFWGWDSKENGAILLVLWNAVILHARWGGLIKDRGLMSLAIIGNIVTAWSWFGTNELGIGLHSYGFTEGVVPILLAVWAVMAVLALLAVTPLASWRSFKWIGPRE